MINSMRIISMNIQSAMNDECFYDIERFLHREKEAGNKVHILCIQETWFGGGTRFMEALRFSKILNNEYKMHTDYENIKLDSYRGMGTAIIYSKEIEIYIQNKNYYKF